MSGHLYPDPVTLVGGDTVGCLEALQSLGRRGDLRSLFSEKKKPQVEWL